MVCLQTTRLIESGSVSYYRVTLNFTSRKGKILWIYSLFLRSLLQGEVQNCNDFIAKGKRSEDPEMNKYLALSISGWSFLMLSLGK